MAGGDDAAVGDASTQDAALSNGYFLAMLSPGMPCCIFTAVAYSAAGTEIGRLGGP